MSETNTQKSLRMTPLWLRAVTALSLAANLAVVGVVIGTALREPPERKHRMKPPPPEAADAIGALMYRKLDDAGRGALRDLAGGSFDNILKRRIAELDELLGLIRAEPLDVDQLRTRLAAQRASTQAMREGMQDIWIAQLARMSQSDRAQFADRVSHHIERLRKPRPDQAKPGFDPSQPPPEAPAE